MKKIEKIFYILFWITTCLGLVGAFIICFLKDMALKLGGIKFDMFVIGLLIAAAIFCIICVAIAAYQNHKLKKQKTSSIIYEEDEETNNNKELNLNKPNKKMVKKINKNNTTDMDYEKIDVVSYELYDYDIFENRKNSVVSIRPKNKVKVI